MAVFSLGQGSPNFQVLSQAKVAANVVWEIIDTVSKQITLTLTKVFKYEST